MRALDDLVRAGKLRYIGVSNFAGWQLMKSLATADAHGWTRYVAHQVYYSLVGRDYERELMPLAHDQGVGAVVWSPLGWGRLTGKIRRGRPLPEGSRLHETAQWGPPVDDDLLYDVVDVLDELSEETGRTVPQIALNWLLRRPTVASVIIGASNEAQLEDNLGAIGWELTADQVDRLDKASGRTAPYPYYPYESQEGFARLNPPIIRSGRPTGEPGAGKRLRARLFSGPGREVDLAGACHIEVQASGDSGGGSSGLSFGSVVPCMSRFRRRRRGPSCTCRTSAFGSVRAGAGCPRHDRPSLPLAVRGGVGDVPERGVRLS